MSSKIPKELIVDASILFSFFKASSARRDILKKLLEQECRLTSPNFVLEELSNNKSDIIKFARIDKDEFDDILSELKKDIDTFKEEKYKEFLPEANKISPHGEQVTKDDPYFALALSFNSPIWSDEEAFKQQSSVKVFTTKELSELLENFKGKSKFESKDKVDSTSEGK